MELSLTLNPAPPAGHVVAAGELDLYSARQVTHAVRRLLGDGCRNLTLDLSAVTFLDAAALGALVRAAAAVRSVSGTFTVTDAGRPVRRVCAMTGLGPAFGLLDAL